jgi:hypothetical protein
MSAPFAFVALWIFSNQVAAQELKLLPTGETEKQIQLLHARLEGDGLGEEERDASFKQLQTTISEFIVAQLEAEPRLPPRDLRGELLVVLGRTTAGQEEAFVQRWPESSGPGETGPVIWGVTYRDAHHIGLMGNRIVVESYVVSRGRARLAGRGGSELDGVAMHANRISNGKNSLSVLIYGVIEWSSGHSLPCKAALYEIDETGVRVTWKIDAYGLEVMAPPRGEAFTIMYHDEKRHASTGDVRLTGVVEVYLVEPGRVRQIVRRRY